MNSKKDPSKGQVSGSDPVVSIYFVWSDKIQDTSLLKAYHKFMDPEDRVQYDRYLFDRHKHQHLVARALVRTTLSRFAPVPPEAWRFSKNEYGRPEIMTPKGMSPLRFNLSHTKTLIVCAVTQSLDIGVDVEFKERKTSYLDIAERFFSPLEAQALKDMASGRQKDRFFDYWTLKESYIKARGMGLAIPLKQFSFLIKDSCPLGIAFDSELNDNEKDWQFALLAPSEQHTAALAIKKGIGPKLNVNINKVIPLVDEEPMTDVIVSSS